MVITEQLGFFLDIVHKSMKNDQPLYSHIKGFFSMADI